MSRFIYPIPIVFEVGNRKLKLFISDLENILTMAYLGEVMNIDECSWSRRISYRRTCIILSEQSRKRLEDQELEDL